MSAAPVTPVRAFGSPVFYFCSDTRPASLPLAVWVSPRTVLCMQNNRTVPYLGNGLKLCVDALVALAPYRSIPVLSSALLSQLPTRTSVSLVDVLADLAPIDVVPQICEQLSDDPFFEYFLSSSSPVPESGYMSISDAVDYAHARDVDGPRLLDALVSRESTFHTGLILKEVSKLLKVYDYTADDMLGFGWRGLRTALLQFDPALGYRFSTYACPKINGAIRDGIRSEYLLPKRLHTYVRKASLAEERLTAELARTPTLDEVTAYVTDVLNETRKDPALLRRLSAPASLDALPLTSHMANDVDVAEQVERGMAAEYLSDALDMLTTIERDLVLAVHYHGTRLPDACAALGVPPAEGRRIKAAALRKLRSTLDVSVLDSI